MTSREDKKETPAARLRQASFNAKYAGFAAVPLNMALDEIEKLERELAEAERNRSEEVAALEHELRVWKEAHVAPIPRRANRHAALAMDAELSRTER